MPTPRLRQPPRRPIVPKPHARLHVANPIPVRPVNLKRPRTASSPSARPVKAPVTQFPRLPINQYSSYDEYLAAKKAKLAAHAIDIAVAANERLHMQRDKKNAEYAKYSNNALVKQQNEEWQVQELARRAEQAKRGSDLSVVNGYSDVYNSGYESSGANLDYAAGAPALGNVPQSMASAETQSQLMRYLPYVLFGLAAFIVIRKMT